MDATLQGFYYSLAAASLAGGVVLAFGRLYFGSLFVRREELAETVDRMITTSEAKHKAALDRQNEIDRRLDDSIGELRDGQKRILDELGDVRKEIRNGNGRH